MSTLPSAPIRDSQVTTHEGSSVERNQKGGDAGFWASLSPQDQKKYTMIFLVSLGTTLLVTGRSGGSLLKRAKKSEASHTPSSSSSSTLTRPTPTRNSIFRSTRPNPSKSTERSEVVGSERSLNLNPKRLDPVALSTVKGSRKGAGSHEASHLLPTTPTSYLDPNRLSSSTSSSRRANRSKKRLLPSFLLPTSTSTSSSSRPSSLETPPASSYFLPNTLLTTQSTAYAKELDRQDKLHEEGTLEAPEVVDDGFNPAVYAMKALGIATLITFTGFGVSIFGLMKWLGVSNMEELSLALTHRLGDTLKENRPVLPAWALPTPSDSTTTTTITPKTPDDSSRRGDPRERGLNDSDSDEDDQEAVSYWSQVKETLDREAEEKKVERREKWTQFLMGKK